MVPGLAIDRFSLLWGQIALPRAPAALSPSQLSSRGGTALIALGVLMVLGTGGRFLAFSIPYRRVHRLPRASRPISWADICAAGGIVWHRAARDPGRACDVIHTIYVQAANRAG